MQTEATPLALRARVAAGDAVHVDGRLRAPHGGGARRLAGACLASSGLPVARWNVADVEDPALVPPPVVREWYEAHHGGLPWRVRVPAGRAWPSGRTALTARCLALEPAAFRPAPVPAGVRLRDAHGGDVAVAAAVLAEGLGIQAGLCRAWLGPQLGSPRHHVVLGDARGTASAIGVAVRAFDRAGPSVVLAALTVLDRARAGLAAALASDLVARGLAGGARLALRVTEDADEDVAPLLAVGFAEVQRLDVHEDA